MLCFSLGAHTFPDDQAPCHAVPTALPRTAFVVQLMDLQPQCGATHTTKISCLAVFAKQCYAQIFLLHSNKDLQCFGCQHARTAFILRGDAMTAQKSILVIELDKAYFKLAKWLKIGLQQPVTHLVHEQAKHACQEWPRCPALSTAQMLRCNHQQRCCSCPALGCMQLCLKLQPVCLQMGHWLLQAQLSRHRLPLGNPVQTSQCWWS